MKSMEYRVWCEEEQAYIEGPLVNGDTGKVCGTGIYEIELFTGKLDKAGRKIYENDILFTEDQNGDRTFYVVAWRDGLLVLVGKTGVDGIIWDGSNKTVLSNVHEWREDK